MHSLFQELFIDHPLIEEKEAKKAISEAIQSAAASALGAAAVKAKVAL